MKIHSSHPFGAFPAQASRGQGGASHAKSADRADDKVSLSRHGALVASLRDDAKKVPSVRPDVVAEAKSALAAGELEKSVDMDKVLNSLLADL